MLDVAVAVWGIVGGAVSADFVAIRTDRLVKELSRQSGVKLECAPEVAAEPLVVRFTDKPIEEVRARLSQVLNAEWTEVQGTLTLRQPAELRRKWEAAETSEVRKSLERLLSEAKAENEKRPPLDAKGAERFVKAPAPGPGGFDQQEYLYQAQANPAARAVIELLNALGANRLASMYTGERTVFSDAPHPIQRPLPNGSPAILARLKKGIELLFTAKAGLSPSNASAVRIGSALEVGPGNPIDGFGKTLFIVQRRALLQFSYSLVVVDRQGKTLVRASGEFPDRNRSWVEAFSNKGPLLTLNPELQHFVFLRKNVGYAAAGGPVAKLPDGTPLHANFGVSFAESEGRPPDMGLGDLLSDPVERDPLGPTFGALIRQVAETRRRPMIATLSDSGVVALLVAFQLQNLRTQADLLDFLTQSLVPPSNRSPHAAILADPDWLLIRPNLAEASRKNRFNRTSLRTLLSQMKAKETITLEDATAYVRSTPQVPSFSSLDLMIIRSAVPTIDRSVPEMIFSPILAFLAEMTPAQFQRLSSGGGIYGELTPKQKETVRRWLYDDFSRTRTESPFGGPSVFRNPLDLEPTELFPTGFPPAAPIRVEGTQLEAVIARATTGYRYALTLDSLVWHESMGPEGDFIGAKFSRHYVGFRPAVQTRYSLVALLSPDVEIRQGTIETKPIEGKSEIKRDQFPESYRKRMEMASAAFRGPSRPSGGPPP